MRPNSIRLPHRKDAEQLTTQTLPTPKMVLVPLSQHMGAPCSPLVKVGDEVRAGEKIGDSEAFFSAPIHAPVTGKVTAVTEYLPISGKPCAAIAIEAATEQREPVGTPPDVTDRESFLAAVRASGAVGLGGAGFPTHVKLAFDPQKTPVDVLIVNAAECEPHITSDYRELMESPDDVLGGIRAVLTHLSIPRAIIGIESNKPAAIALLRERTKGMADIAVAALPSAYPQGAEKVLIYSTTKRTVKEGELPLHQGVVVMNCSTLGFLHRYLQTGIPLIQRRITVGGDCVERPCNVFVPIGTPIAEVLAFAGLVKEPRKVLMGGPMMGLCVPDTATPVVKQNNAILALHDTAEKRTTACLRCSRCLEVCPVRLMPNAIERAYRRHDPKRLAALHVGLCVNCGSCTYICPAARPLAETNQLAKTYLAAHHPN